jgi:hypothetical protein
MTASMRSKRVRRSLGATVLVAGAMLLAACGDDGGTSTASSTGTGGSGASGGGNPGTGGSGGTTTGGGGGGDGGSTGGSAGTDNTGGAGGASGGAGGASGGAGGAGATGGSTTGGGAGGASGGTGGTGATGGSTSGGTGGSTSGGTGGSTSGGTGGSTGGAGGAGGSGGSSDGGVPPDGGTDPNPARCAPSIAWQLLERVESIPNDHFARFGGVSPDELTAAWTSGSGDVYVADRTSYKDPFAAPVKVNTMALASDRVAIAATGQSLIAVNADRGSFIGFERPGRDAPWVVSNGLEFTQVKVVFEGGALVSEPVLSGDKRSFFFLVTPPGQPTHLREAVWDPVQRSWGLPARVPNAEFEQAAGGKRRRPTGMSSDGRTLFFFDEASSIERAAWRNAPSAPFDLFKDVGAFGEAIPNLRCDTLYYQGQDSVGPGVFMGE